MARVTVVAKFTNASIKRAELVRLKKKPKDWSTLMPIGQPVNMPGQPDGSFKVVEHPLPDAGAGNKIVLRVDGYDALTGGNRVASVGVPPRNHPRKK